MEKKLNGVLDGRILNCEPSVKTENDWTIETAEASDILRSPARLPGKKDLREDDWWKVNDQGYTGSCVGWAAADSVLRWHLVKYNMLRNDELLSARYLWMAAKETDVFNHRPSTFLEEAGTSLKAALDVLRNYGMVRDALLPFEPISLFRGKENVFYSIASQFKIRNYFNLNYGDKIRNWKKWLNVEGPILARLNVDDSFDDVKRDGIIDVYKGPQHGGHAIAIVGYTSDRIIIRNSWGKAWGDKGYAYVSYEYAKMAFTESYGINLFGNRTLL